MSAEKLCSLLDLMDFFPFVRNPLLFLGALFWLLSIFRLQPQEYDPT